VCQVQSDIIVQVFNLARPAAAATLAVTAAAASLVMVVPDKDSHRAILQHSVLVGLLQPASSDLAPVARQQHMS